MPEFVVIRIAETDYTDKVVFASAQFESAVNGATGRCKFRLRDDDRTISFATGEIIDLLINGEPCWTGYLTKQSRVYAFPAENVDDAGLTRWLDIEGVDINILFSRRIVFDSGDGAQVLMPTPPYPPNTADTTAIGDLVGTYLDLSGDALDVSTLVENVADINEDQDARPFSGSNQWGQGMQSIASLPGAVWFLDPGRHLVYTDVNTASAPFPLSDVASGGGGSWQEPFDTDDPSGWPDWTEQLITPTGGATSTASVASGHAHTDFTWDALPGAGSSSRAVEYWSHVIPAGVAGSDIWRFTIKFQFDAMTAAKSYAYLNIQLDDGNWGCQVGNWKNTSGVLKRELWMYSPAEIAGVFAFSNSLSGWDATEQYLEMDHQADGTTELRLWPVSGSRPASPDYTFTDATSPFNDGLIWIWTTAGVGQVVTSQGDAGSAAFVIDLISLTWGAPAAVVYREMTITKDANQMANDVLGWGIGYGSNTPIFDRDTDATSVSTHGLWQQGSVTSGVYKQATIDRIVDSIINGSPTNKRGAKDDRVAVNLVTYSTGFQPAQKVDFTSAVWDFNDVIPIRHMRVTFDAPDTPKFELQLSHAIDAPWSFFDPFVFRIPPIPLPVLPPLPVIPQLCPPITDPWGNATETGPTVTNRPGNVVSAGASGPIESSLIILNPDPTGNGAHIVNTLSVAETFDPNEFRLVLPLEFDLLMHTQIVASSRSTDPTDQGNWNYGQIARGGFWVTFTGGALFGTSLALAHDLSGVVTYPPAYTIYTFTPPTFTTTDDSTAYIGLHSSDTGGTQPVFTDSISAQTSFGGSFVYDRSLSRGSVRWFVPGYGWHEESISADWSGMTAPVLHLGARYQVDPGPGMAVSSHDLVLLGHSLGIRSDDTNFSSYDISIAYNLTTSNLILFGAHICPSSDSEVDPPVVGTGFSPDSLGYGCETPNPADPPGTTNTTYVTGFPFTPLSTTVWRGGLLQRRDTDYTEGGDSQSIVFTTAVGPTEPIRVCYQVAVQG